MLNKDKFTLLLASAVILLPIPVRLLMGLGWSFIMVTPLMLLAAFWACIWFTLKDPNNKNKSTKPYRGIFWVIPALSILISAADYCFTTRADFDFAQVLFLFLGALFCVIGNSLPKVRQNSTYGIKLPWTYSSEENWNATHRFGGKVWFVCGLLTMVGSFLPGKWSVSLMLAMVAAAILVPSVYSYLFYRRQKEAGITLSPMPILPGKSAKTSLIFLAAVLLFVACTLFTGDLRYRYGDTSFTVEASYFDDLTVNYADIQDVQYMDGNMPGVRVWGFGSLRLLMGTFESEGIQYTRYTYYDPDSAVGVLLEDKMIILSGKNPDESKAIYETLRDKCGLDK